MNRTDYRIFVDIQKQEVIVNRHGRAVQWKEICFTIEDNKLEYLFLLEKTDVEKISYEPGVENVSLTIKTPNWEFDSNIGLKLNNHSTIPKSLFTSITRDSDMKIQIETSIQFNE